MGDVKLLGVMGLFLGRPVIVALLVALLGSIVAGRGHRPPQRRPRRPQDRRCPFGPYLAAGGIVAALVGDSR